jgi:predicted aldo/keto reductase-like oxidoreductase
MNFHDPVILGRTGLKVGRLGISSSYGAPAVAFEEAFEKGCNYFTYGTFIKGGSPEMRKAVRNIVSKGQRNKLVVAIYTYAHWPLMTQRLFPRDLKKLGVDYADILILGYYSSLPGGELLDMANQLKEKGLVRFIGLSGHKRKLFPVLAEKKIIDVLHVRYNAIHRGAEKDVFPFITGQDLPGIVSFTATRWGKLINPRNLPDGLKVPKPTDAYRFVLSNPAVDVCMIGTNSLQQMREDLKVLDFGPLNQEEMNDIRSTGEYLYTH